MKKELNAIFTAKDDEIALFTKMASILSTKYHVAFIGKTHQQYVCYYSKQVNQIVKKEISDLWIIAYSPTQHSIRMTFLQAKYHRKNLNQLQSTFVGDYFQYELLSKRPILTKVIGQRYNFPSDILSFSCCTSIGSYGVFFIDNNKQIDLAYCSANYLKMTTAAPTIYISNKTYNISLEIPHHNTLKMASCSYNQCLELISCFDIDTFTNSILQLEIGAELIYYPFILASIRSILNTQSSNTAVSQLIDVIDNQQFPIINDDNIGFEERPSNLLIINTDEKSASDR